jgi:hypothetical protein
MAKDTDRRSLNRIRVARTSSHRGHPSRSKHLGQPSQPPPAQRSGGPAGNERLTAMTGTVLLIVLAVGCPSHDHSRRHGRADRAADGRAALRRRAFRPRRGPRRHGARRHGHRRLDPVHRGVPGDVPGREHPRHGVEDPDTRTHGPNERLHVPEFERAVRAKALLLQRLGGA